MLLESLGQVEQELMQGNGLPFTELMLAIYPHLTGEQNTASFMRGIYKRLS